jgi:hypothetical protein
MGRIRFIALLLALAGRAEGHAAPTADAESAKPYDYRVILRIAPHRLLTPAFRRQIRDDLQDGVQAALRSLAQVSVVEAGSGPKDAWIDLAALDGRSETGSAKRHFVEVSFADGRYIVRARQLDGSTGLASPVIREARTPDRTFVGRLIEGFIAQDFGPVGAVVDFDKSADRATLELRCGRSASGELARMVPTGSVFALARIEGSPPRGRPVEAAYLVTLAEPADGRCDCRVVSRYAGQLADWSTVTHRALKLGTGQGPVKLRLVDKDGLPPAGLQIQVSADGFRSERIIDQGAARDGVFETAHSYDRMAYVLVSSGSLRVAQVPVPVIDDRVTTCRVTAAAGGEARQQHELDVGNVYQRLLDIRRRLLAQHGRLKKLTDAQNHADALAEISRGLDSLDAELTPLTAEVNRLKREPGGGTPGVGPVLGQCDILIQEVRKQRSGLLQDQVDLQKAVQSEKEQEPKRDDFIALSRRAREMEEEADFDEALKTYDEILRKIGERPEVRKKRDKLKQDWEIKSDAHRQARAFAYGTWTNLRSVDDIEQNLPKAREAFQTCKQVGDRLTPIKLLNATLTAAEILSKAGEEIKSSESDTDKLNLPRLQKLGGELREFTKEVHDYARPDEAAK